MPVESSERRIREVLINCIESWCEMKSEGFDAKAVHHTMWSRRYRGQSYELDPVDSRIYHTKGYERHMDIRPDNPGDRQRANVVLRTI
jgi:hypothetical protein